MADGYATRGVLKYDDLPSRRDFLKGGIDPHADNPLRLSVHKLDEMGRPSPDAWFDVIFLKSQMLSIDNDERVQYVVNSEDDGKAYFFGRTHRMYSVSAFLIDSDLESDQVRFMLDEGIVAGDVAALWEATYDQYLRATQAVKQRLVSAIKWQDNTFWGYLLGMNMSDTADNDNVVTVSFSFFSVRDDLVGTLPFIDDRFISEKAFEGLRSEERL